MVLLRKIIQRRVVQYRFGIIICSLVAFFGVHCWMTLFTASQVSNVKNFDALFADREEPRESYTFESPASNVCDIAHIAIVCAGYDASRDVVTLIKSLLFYRNTLLHIHFVADPPAKKILGTLFRTWNIPDLTVSFYSSKLLEDKVAWIPNSHYAGVFGLLKLAVMDVLPPKVERIIVLDVDLVFLSDIAGLWAAFAKFSKDQIIGLVENQSDWYLGNISSTRPWPARGRGFNSGVMLLDLRKLSRIDWNSLWNSITKEELKHHGGTALADQDIINAIINVHYDILFILPCVWNVQLSEHSRASLCYGGDTSKIKLLHWNAPGRLKSENNPQFLYQYFYSFSMFDNNLLKKPVVKCGETSSHKEDSSESKIDFCQNMLDNVSKLRKVHLYFMYFEQSSYSRTDVTLVSHLSTNRISILEAIAEHWAGPISVAIYVTEQDAMRVKNLVLNSPTLSNRKNIGYHLMFEDQDDIAYPINLLRNIALQQAISDFVFLCDADFLPSTDLYHYLTKVVLPTTSRHNKTAYVIPAFEKLRYGNNIPQTKSNLLRQWDSASVLPFRQYMWPEGHNSTDYTKWRHSSHPYEVRWTKNYEPYIVASKSLCPYFDKRFFGFGWNKVSHIMELDAAGFKFFVLPYVFIVHIAHFASPDLRKFRMSKTYQDCVSELKLEFIDDLVAKYQVNASRYV